MDGGDAVIPPGDKPSPALFDPVWGTPSGFRVGEIITGTVDAQGKFVPGPIPHSEPPAVGRVTEVTAESITVSFAPELPPCPE